MKRIAIAAFLIGAASLPAHASTTAPPAPSIHSSQDAELRRLRVAGDLAAALAEGREPSDAIGRYRDAMFGASIPEPFGAGPVIRQVYPVGDMDGDGAGDLVAVEWRNANTPLAWYARGTTIFGLRGRDGSVLWQWEAGPLEFAYVYPAARLGPSGRPGVFVLAQSLSGLWRVAAIDASGTQRWERWFPPDGGAGTPVGVLSLQFPLLPLADGTGDGTSDVIVPSWLFVYTGVDTRITIVATVLDGATGEIHSVLTTQGRNAAPALEAAGDVDGDGATDVLAAEPDETAFTISAVRVDGSKIWSAPATGGLFCFLEPGPDSDGDGAGDVVVWFPSLFERAPADTVTMIGGADGTVLWTAPGDFPRATHDVDGDGFVDVRAVRVSGPSFWQPDSLTFDARRGSDGTVLYAATHVVPAAPNRALNLIGDASDADADGIGDWVFTVRRYDADWNELAPATGAVSGADGSTLWTDEPGLPLGADADGDGGADQIAGSVESRAVRIQMVRGPDGQRTWNTAFKLTSDAYLLVVFVEAADLTGDGIAEVLLTVYTLGPSSLFRGAVFSDMISQVFVHDGASGARLWSLG